VPRILLSDPVSKLCAERLLEEPGFEVDSRPGLTPDELKAVLPGVDALVVRSATKVTREILDAASTRRPTSRPSAAPAPGWTTSMWRPPPSAASW